MSVNFDSGSEYLHRSSGLLDLTADFTMMFWVREVGVPTTGNLRTLWNRYSVDLDYSQPYFGIFGGPSTDDLIWELYDGTNFIDAPTVLSVTDGQFTHVAVTVASGVVKFYKNGVQVGSNTTVDFSSMSTAATEYLANDGGGEWSSLDMCFFRQWTAALSAAEIQQEMVSPTAARTANLWVDTPLEVFTDLTDVAGNSRNWAANGTLATNPAPFLYTARAETIGLTESDNGTPPPVDRGPSPSATQVRLPAGYQLAASGDQLSQSAPWPAGDFTIAFWAKKLRTWEIDTTAGTSERISLALDVTTLSPSSLPTEMDFSAYTSFTVGPTAPVGLWDLVARDAWHYYAVVHSGDDYYVSIDLQPFVQLTKSFSHAWNAEYFSNGVGTVGYISQPQIAYYRMWDAVLGLGELRAERVSRTAVRATNLYRDTPLETSLNDVSGNGRNWSATGAPVAVLDGGPLPYVAEAVTVNEGVGAVVQAAGSKARVELLRVLDVLRGTPARALVKTEALTVLDRVALGPPNAKSARVVRWYPLGSTNGGVSYPQPAFVPSALQGGWSRTTTILSFKLGTAADLPIPLSNTAWAGANAYSGASITAGTTAYGATLASEALPAQTIGGLFNCAFYVAGSSTGKQHFRIYIWVTQGASNAVRGVLLDYAEPASNCPPWGSSGNMRQLPAPVALTPVTLQANDRVIIELGFSNEVTFTGSNSFTYSLGSYGAKGPNPGVNVEDAVPLAPGASGSLSVSLAGNGYADFLDGIFVSALPARARETVTVAEKVFAYGLGLKVTETIHVAEAVTKAAGAVVTSLSASVNDLVSVVDSPDMNATVTPVSTSTGSGGLALTVAETITVTEYRYRVAAGVSSLLTVQVIETISCRESRQGAGTSTVWDGSGSAPPPATIDDDYWLVGV